MRHGIVGCTGAAAMALASGLMTGTPARAAAAADMPLPAQGSLTTAAPPAPTPPPPPYSLPWQLRPTAAATVLRLDTSLGLYEATDPAGGKVSGSTVASTFLASYKVSPNLAPLLRVGVVQNEEPGQALGAGTAFVNPIVGLTYARKLPGAFRGAGFFAVTLPIGMGGAEKRAMDETAAAVFRGIATRSGMDNAMFAVNYFTAIAGAGAAFVARGLTVQAEATVLQLFRVRHEDVDVDERRTNLTAGLHVGYFIIPALSVAAELRHQRWLSTPAAVKTNGAARDTTTVAIGPRAHFKVGESKFLRPGLSYSRGLDKPLSDAEYHILQVDVPLVF